MNRSELIQALEVSVAKNKAQKDREDERALRRARRKIWRIFRRQMGFSRHVETSDWAFVELRQSLAGPSVSFKIADVDIEFMIPVNTLTSWRYGSFIVQVGKDRHPCSGPRSLLKILTDLDKKDIAA